MTAAATSQAGKGRPTEPLLRVQGLTKDFRQDRLLPFGKHGVALRAVDHVSFDVFRGETFGLVGESGCGKSTLARCILRLLDPTSGRIVFNGQDITALGSSELRTIRRKMQIVFQDPFGSLNPRMSVQAIVEEPLVIHGIGTRRERRPRALETLELVGITRDQAGRRPHEFSGGQRQRIALARALILRPDLVILDEPVSALDVSIQAQVLNLLRDLQQQLDLTYIFIIHDLAVAEYFCDRLAVLYLGAVMETTDRFRLFREPLHPYTGALLSAVPVPDPAIEHRRPHVVLADDVDGQGDAQGCRFRPRCPVGRDRDVCRADEPLLVEHRPAHEAACHFPGELSAKVGLAGGVQVR